MLQSKSSLQFRLLCLLYKYRSTISYDDEIIYKEAEQIERLIKSHQEQTYHFFEKCFNEISNIENTKTTRKWNGYEYIYIYTGM